MNSKEALENIVIDFDNMGMICSNLCYEEFYCKDLHFKEIFKTEYESILRDLERLEKLEDNIKIHKETIKMQHNQIESLQSENAKLKKVIEFIKENFEVELHYDEEYDEYTICFMEYNECLEEIAITGITKYVNKEEYDLLKEYL